jgi:hypothetical protein
MLISLHKQATTMPKVRAAIRASGEPAWILAERHGVSDDYLVSSHFAEWSLSPW